jgi:uncharacterized membrane protein YphA (DoxX/SURF4 family)
MNALTRPLLVLLRLVIGWHILFEGVDKLSKAEWSNEPYLRELAHGPRANAEKLREFKKSSFSSDPYLREASGPLASFFHWMDGDPLAARLTLTEDGKFPPALDRDWKAYFDRFAAYHKLDPKQWHRAEANLKQSEETTLLWLLFGTKVVTKLPPAGNAVSAIEMTTPQRVALYLQLLQEARRIQTQDLSAVGKPMLDRAKAVKEEADRLRNDLRNDLDRQTVDMYKHLHDVVSKDPAPPRYSSVWLFSATPTADVSGIFTYDLRSRYRLPVSTKDIDLMPTPDAPPWKEWTWQRWQPYVIWGGVAVIGAVFILSCLSLALGALWRSHRLVVILFVLVVVLGLGGYLGWLWYQGTLTQWYDEALAIGTGTPAAANSTLPSWIREILERRLELIDITTKWGLTIIGACLLMGLFTRTACVAGAGLLLLFFLAMPPLPWLPELPRAEGHYLYINKNIIEMVALLALATTRSGRWLGLDGLLQFFSLRRWLKTEPDDGSSDTPRSASPTSLRRETQPTAAFTP